MEYLNTFLLLFITPECSNIFFKEYNFFHAPCLKATASKGMGYGIIAGSALVKLPQIVKICSNQSAEGISIFGQLFELYGVTASVAYNYIKNFPFSAWGDSVFMLIQTSTIAGLSLYFNKNSTLSALFISLYSILLYAFLSGFVSSGVLWTIQATSVPVMFIGKLIQARQNYITKSMGQQSVITIALLFLGSLARVFTSIQETGDFIIILSFSLATLANGIVLSQFAMYPSSAIQVKKNK